MSLRNDQKVVSKEAFIGGSFDLFVEHQALHLLQGQTSVHRLTNEQQEQLRAVGYESTSVPKVAVHIQSSLDQKQNPIMSPAIQNDFDFARVVSYYDVERPEDSFSLERALDIALNDKSDDLAPFRDLVDQRGQSAGVHAMGEYLTKLVNQEVAARVSEVAIESCLSPNGATLVNTIESTQNSITKPLEQMHALQNDLAVGLTAMHQLKNSILTDYSPQNMEFLSKYGHSLANSDLSVSSLNNLTLRMNEMGDSVPLSVAQLQSASIEMMSPDSTSGINYGRHFESVRLPSNELDMAKTLTREGLNLSTPQFDDALLMARLEIGQIVVDSPSVTIDNTADMTRSLSELLNKTKNEPSKTTSIDSDSPSM